MCVKGDLKLGITQDKYFQQKHLWPSGVIKTRPAGRHGTAQRPEAPQGNKAMEISRSLDHQEPRRTDYGVRDAWLPDPGATTYALAMLSPA